MAVHDAAPESMAELIVRQAANVTYSGMGAETVTRLPCPFCGAAGWLEFPVVAARDGYAAVQEPHSCGECGRTAKLTISRSADGAETTMTMHQTAGPDAPPWLAPPIPRAGVDPVAAGGELFTLKMGSHDG